MYERLKTISSVAMILVFGFAAARSQAEQIDLSTPVCPVNYIVKGAKCEVDPKLKTDPPCRDAGGTLVGGECKFPGAPPAPSCRGVAGGTQKLQGEKCIFDSSIETSASGDYVGDHFKIVSVPADAPDRLGGPAGTRMKVLSQKPLGANDRMLTVIPVESKGEWDFFNFRDKPIGKGVAKEVKASDYIEYGADRNGWTFGALAIPFKYYLKDRNFGPGIAIGPYVGRRWGTPGSAYTFAVAATIGNVKGEVRDAQDKIISTPDLMAYSVAMGWMWDISKAEGVKPFKLGVFFGADAVSNDNVVKYKNNRKGWIALQVGFDFTDN